MLNCLFSFITPDGVMAQGWRKNHGFQREKRQFDIETRKSKNLAEIKLHPLRKINFRAIPFAPEGFLRHDHRKKILCKREKKKKTRKNIFTNIMQTTTLDLSLDRNS